MAIRIKPPAVVNHFFRKYYEEKKDTNYSICFQNLTEMHLLNEYFNFYCTIKFNPLNGTHTHTFGQILRIFQAFETFGNSKKNN